jgi:hypothetical protein
VAEWLSENESESKLVRVEEKDTAGEYFTGDIKAAAMVIIALTKSGTR